MLGKFTIVLMLAACCAAQPSRGSRTSLHPATGDQNGILRLPEARLRRLPNGLQAIVVHSPGSLRTVLELRVAASSINDAGQPGISEATAQLLITDELRQRLEDYGASIEVAAAYGSFNTAFSLSAPNAAFNEAVEQFFEALAHPQFTAPNLASWRRRRAVELEADESSPSYLAESILDRALYHDGRHWAGPTMQSLQEIDVPALETFYHEFYSPCRGWVGVIGPAGREATVARLIHASRAWHGCSHIPVVKLEDAPSDERSVYLLNQPQMQQAYLQIGGLNVYRLAPDYPSALVLNRILGGIPGGRLWQVMRQQEGSTYDVRSSLTALKYLHHFAISVTLSPEGVKEAIRTVWQQLELLRASPPSAEEVESARSSILGEFLRTLESSNEILNLLMTRFIYGLPATYWENYARSLKAVSPQSVQAAAIQYLNPEHMQIIAIGNAEILKLQLEHQGPFHELEPQVFSRK